MAGAFSPARGQALLVAGEPVVVAHGNACGAWDIPDSPARAMRLADDQILLIAAHFNNVPLVGPDLAALAPVCGTQSLGREDADPAAFDDRWWIQAIVPGRPRGVLAVASHEFDGRRHPGACRATGPGACWYSSIVLAQTAGDDLHFRLLDPGVRVIASPERPYDPGSSVRVGFFSVSNILRSGGFAYMFVYAENTNGIARGNCLLRASEDALGTWRAFLETDFTSDLARGGRCTPVKGLDTPLRSFVVLPDGSFAAVTFAGRAETEGVYLLRSESLMAWDEKSLFLPAHSPYVVMGCGTFYEYPSLLEWSSGDPQFDRLNRTPSLLLSRFNFEDCKRDHRKRDLVRVPLAFAPKR